MILRTLKRDKLQASGNILRHMAQTSTMRRIIAQPDKGFTPLDLSQDTPDETNSSERDELTKKIQRWQEKSLYGRYAEEIEACFSKLVV